MPKDNGEIPDNLKRMLRQTWLEERQHGSSLDEFELELFEWYVKETDNVIDNMLATELEYVQEQTESGAEDINDSGIMAAEYYLKRIRYSHIVYLTSILETFLEQECDRLKAAVGEHNVPFSLYELNGNQWEKKRKYLERYGKLKITDEVWRGIHDLIVLRNIVVHDNGTADDLDKVPRQTLKQHAGIRWTDSNVQVESSYITEALASVRKLCGEVRREVNNAIQRAIRPAPVHTSGRD